MAGEDGIRRIDDLHEPVLIFDEAVVSLFSKFQVVERLQLSPE